MNAPLRVGIIGVSAEGGWARDGHVPALRGLAGLEFAALATNGRRTADAAARAFGVAAAFASGLDLIASREVDIVTVATRVPDHRALVLAAIAAGKHVYCEWPLGRSSAEAEEMHAAAAAAGVHVAIGLQLRGSPAARAARAAIASGKIGRVLSVRVKTSTAGFGRDVRAADLYLEEPENFANLVTIQGAHTIDLALAIGGALVELSALATRQYPELRAGDDGELRPRRTFDHLSLLSRYVTGASLTVDVAGGRPPEAPFVFEAFGETGALRLEGAAARGVQTAALTLVLDGVAVALGADEIAAMPAAATNVAGVYAMLRDDIANGTSTATDFGHAAKLTRLIEDVFASSEAGKRMLSEGWPDSLGARA